MTTWYEPVCPYSAWGNKWTTIIRKIHGVSYTPLHVRWAIHVAKLKTGSKMVLSYLSKHDSYSMSHTVWPIQYESYCILILYNSLYESYIMSHATRLFFMLTWIYPFLSDNIKHMNSASFDRFHDMLMWFGFWYLVQVLLKPIVTWFQEFYSQLCFRETIHSS